MWRSLHVVQRCDEGLQLWLKVIIKKPSLHSMDVERINADGWQNFFPAFLTHQTLVADNLIAQNEYFPHGLR